AYVNLPERSLRRIIHVSCEENSSGARAEDRLACVSEAADWSSEPFFLDELEHRRALAARQNQTVDTSEFIRAPYFDRVRAGSSKRSSVRIEVTLNCQHANHAVATHHPIHTRFASPPSQPRKNRS